jgi:hypothetical protein
MLVDSTGNVGGIRGIGMIILPANFPFFINLSEPAKSRQVL